MTGVQTCALPIYSNEIIYKGFFSTEPYSDSIMENLKIKYLNLDASKLKNNYFSDSFGDKFFSHNDAKLIGYIRQDIEDLLSENKINNKEYFIILTSLIYSMDKISNTVGHYEAYFKNKELSDNFSFTLISPYKTKDKKISIYRCDANQLAPNIKTDIAFIDPPYNSRQYSRSEERRVGKECVSTC